MKLANVLGMVSLCAGLGMQASATEYEYVHEGPVKIALTWAHTEESLTRETDTSSKEVWKCEQEKIVNADVLDMYGYGKDDKLMVRWVEEGESKVFFVRTTNNVDEEIDLNVEGWGWASSGSHTDTWPAEGKAGTRQCNYSEKYTELVTLEIESEGISLGGIDTGSLSEIESEKEDAEGNTLSSKSSVTMSGKIAVHGAWDAEDRGGVLTGTISYSIKTVKKAVAE